MSIGRTDAEAEAPDAKNWLIEKDPNAEKDWRQEEKETTEDEMVGWHHRLNGREFERALGVGEGQGSLGCCSPWGHKELDMTNDWTEWVRDKRSIVKLQKKRWVRKVLYIYRERERDQREKRVVRDDFQVSSLNNLEKNNDIYKNMWVCYFVTDIKMNCQDTSS